MQDNNKSVIALDYGNKRIGVALASRIARLPHPLTTLINDQDFKAKLKDIIVKEDADTIVVGYPRDINGNSTEQTRIVDTFLDTLSEFGLNIEIQDEALTSTQAEEQLKSRNPNYKKEEIDAVAAAIILEDYLNSPER
jgi:putative Holliday junction resolvase